MRHVHAIETLAERYALFLFDQFGVLHDGVRAYPGVHATLRAIRAAGKRIGVVTNSGKRAAYNRERLAGFGFDGSLIDVVASSGEVAWRQLSERYAEPSAAPDPARLASSAGPGAAAAGGTEWRPARVLVVDRGTDRDFLAALPLRETDDAAACDLVLIAGCEPERISLDAYRERLAPAAARGVPALCTNPDRTMLLGGGRTGFAPGVVADAYAALGAPVTRIGKPWPAIYAYALERADVSAGQTLCIGDSVEHDVAGARAAGCDALLVRTGIHAGASETELDALFDAAGVRPEWLVASR